MSFLSILAVFVRAAGGFPAAPAKKREKTADAEHRGKGFPGNLRGRVLHHAEEVSARLHFLR